jgi:hypothetical protein
VTTDRLLELLLDHGVEFVVVGGVAAVLHGSTLLTRDLDICVPPGSESFLKIQAALVQLNPRVRSGPGLIPLSLDAAQAQRLRNLYISTDEGRLDCLGYVDGVGDFDAVLRESIKIELGRHSCRVLGIDGLIRAKEAIGRPRDQQSIKELKAIRERTEPTTRDE